MSDQLSKNMRLLGQDRLLGHGGIGEGMAMSRTADGRRVMWLAHEGPPKNFTAVDVTDPTRMSVICQTELPHMRVRSNSLEITGDLMAVAYQTVDVGMSPAGIELFDISVPETPRSISFFDCSGPHSRGVHQVWFVDGEYIHCSSGAADFEPTNKLDDQFYMIVDVRTPTAPREVGRWWLPGTRKGDSVPPPARLPRFDFGVRAHNTNVYPERPDRAYVGYFDGGAVILDIADKSQPKLISHWNPAPPYMGLTHTVLPLFSRGLLVIPEEAVIEGAEDWPKLTWLVDARKEDNLVPMSSFPLPPVEEFRPRGGRYGSHNLHENHPGELSFRSDTLIFGTYFSGGVRVFDTSNPHQPKEVAYFVPENPGSAPAPQAASDVAQTGWGIARPTTVKSSQINDVYVDDRGIVFAVDRYTGGLYAIEIDV